MAQGKHLSLEEARKSGKLGQFAKEHPSQADERFWPLLNAMARGSQEAPQISSRAVSADCNGTQTPRDRNEDGGG